MWKFLLLLSGAAILANSVLVPKSVRKLKIPGIPGLDINLTPLRNRDKITELGTGFGIFNLGTDVQKMIFTLHTTKENKEEVLNPESHASFLNSAWDETQKTIIIVHGHTEDATGGPLSATKKIVEAYVNANRPENIVFVDWCYLARQINYFTSASNTIKVGLRVAEFIMALRNAHLITNLDQVHLVGFSLGAHVSGVAAYWANALIPGEKIARISALDAAGPGFNHADLQNRLDSSDAKFVDAIHTNLGDSITTFNSFGSRLKIGHADFYPNGGEHQPGCTYIPVFGGACSHIKATDYFANSILGTKYIGCQCSDWSTFQKGACNCTNGPLMGEFVDPSTIGDYYLAIPLGQ